MKAHLASPTTTAPARPSAAPSDDGPQQGDGHRDERRTVRLRNRDKEADAMAVASFVLGLVGLLVFNLVLGPCAVILGAAALVKGTGRRGRAALGIGLGVADLVLLAALVTFNGTVVWGLA